MTLHSRITRAESAAKQTRGFVMANNWPCTEPPHLLDKWQCPEFDGKDVSQFHHEHVFGQEADYHFSLDELKAEARRRGVELQLIEYYDYGKGP